MLLRHYMSNKVRYILHKDRLINNISIYRNCMYIPGLDEICRLHSLKGKGHIHFRQDGNLASIMYMYLSLNRLDSQKDSQYNRHLSLLGRQVNIQCTLSLGYIIYNFLGINRTAQSFMRVRIPFNIQYKYFHHNMKYSQSNIKCTFQVLNYNTRSISKLILLKPSSRE